MSLYFYFIFYYLPFLIIPFLYMKSNEIGFKEINCKTIVKDLFFYIVGLFLIIFVTNLLVYFLSFFIKNDLNNVAKKIAYLNFGEKVLLVYLSGIVEEIFFRGFLQNKIGILPSSLIFSYLHFGYGSILEVINVFVVSIILGVIYKINNNRIYSNILIHSTFNALSLFH